jgi:fatty-acyl-CoA synthase
MSVTTGTGSIFERGLPKTRANYCPLTPLDFLAWAACTFPERTGVVYGETRYSYGELDGPLPPPRQRAGVPGRGPGRHGGR